MSHAVESTCLRSPQLSWLGVTSLALFLILASVGAAQELPQVLEIRLRNLSKVNGNEAATRECSSLLTLIDEVASLEPERRALGLDRLRDACADKLAWTDPVLARIAEQAVTRRRPLEAAEPAALCQAMRDLALSYHYLTRVERAHSLYQEAVKVARRWQGRGTTNEDVAAALESLSGLQLDLRQFDQAKESIEESLRLRRRAMPFLLEKVVSALGTRARIEMLHDLPRAKATLLEARRLSRDLGPEHTYASTRIASNLGEILFRLGELPQAIALLQEAEAQRLRERSLGRPVRQLAATQLLLGQVFVDLGDYPQAISYYRKALQGHREWLGKDPYRYCDALTGLASVLEESGRWEEAQVLQREALAIREEAARNQSDPELQLMLTRSLTSVGALQQRKGDTAARESLERALRIQDHALPERVNVDRAQTLLELARYWEYAGDAQRARGLINRCLQELAALGEQGPLLFEAQEMAGRIAANSAEGLRLLEKAGQLAQKLYGQDSPSMVGIFQARAELRQRQGDATGALGDALAAQKISLPHVTTVVQAFPRDQALAFASDRRKSLDLMLRLLAEGPARKPEVVAQVWQTAASSRMLVRDAEIDRRRLSLITADSDLAAAARRLASARERFAYLLVQSEGNFETRAGRLVGARRQLLEAEEALAAKTRSVLSGGAITPLSVERLRRSLPSKASLVAFFQYQKLGTHAYLAFVLNGSGPARVVALGEGVAIEWLIEQWRAAILNSRTDPVARMRTGQALRRAIWDPVASKLDSAKTIFLVPDGALHLVPFVALPLSQSSYLIEQGWAFHTLTVERDLLAGSSPRRSGPWLALGGVDYERAAAQAATSTRQSTEVLRGDDPERGDECRKQGLPTFVPLPGSREEIEDLTAIWRQLPARSAHPRPALTTLVGQDATEHALRLAVRGRRIVHLATHGFVSASGCYRSALPIRGIGGLSLGTGTARVDQQPFSGLVFAGANDRGKASRSDQDGILTEEEILSLDLATADWVVLSACDTGLGRTRPGEGVVGMLRAFQVAGARTVIVSLWSIEDQAARIWMRELYRARFEDQLTTLQAMQQASLRSLLLHRQKGDDNPARWAGFVASGHWS